ncbi:DNA methyltransferase [Leuconostocaceae bacterium ESL0958]|nr:DNA methyltransferase [Leuconostocaceae bacterium ESL0958]
MTNLEKGLKDNKKFNKHVEADTSFLEELREKLPRFFNDSGFDIKKFEAELRKANPTELTSGYRLDFIGKDYAKRQVGERPTSVIISDDYHNGKDINQKSKNLFFTGDNLEVLRHLRQNYANSVDFIYIDPPYNTGSDGFVYPDSFQVTDDMLVEFGVDPNDKKEVTEFKERYDQQGKKSHSAWLTFMYPRLVLARKLLKDDGVIFVSIDDNEQANLKLMLDDLFGEENSETLIWNKNAEGKSGDLKQVKHVRNVHEYVQVAYKNGKKKQFKKIHEAVAGRENEFQTANLAINEKNARTDHENYYSITNPSGDVFTKQWKWSKEKIDELIAEDLIFWGSDGHKQPRLIIPLDERRTTYLLSILNYGGTTVGRTDLEKTLGEDSAVFSYPKPIILLKKLLATATEKDSLVMDFFAGSATTADAVIQLNKKDGGERQYIMVQLPEGLATDSAAAKAGFKTIDEISRVRIEKAAENIGDTSGYKHYTVENVQADTLDKLEKFDSDVVLTDDMVTDIPGGVDTLLTTWMTADGYKFDEPVEKKRFSHGTGYYVAGSVLYIFENTWDSEATKQLLNELGKHSFNLNTIIVSEYALTFEAMMELKTNIKILKDKDFDIQVEVRN